MVRAATQPGEVMVDDLVTLAYRADSGFDFNFVPRAVVTKLIDVGSKLEVKVLSKPVDAAVAGGSIVTCWDSVDVDIVLQTAAGPVHLRELDCLIMVGTETDFLLSNETLVSLRIDVNQQLQQLSGIGFPEDSDPFEEEGHTDVVLTSSEVHTKLEELVCKFLREYTKRSDQLGFIKQNNQSHWASAAVPVAKPKSPDDFRMTVDYRPVNALTIPIVGATQDVTDSAEEAEGSYGYGDFDMPKGFWQLLPLHPNSQEIMSFITTDTLVFLKEQASQQHTSRTMCIRFLAAMLYVYLLVWIDDILVYVKGSTIFYRSPQAIFWTLRAHRLKLIVSKSCLFRKEIRWYGRITSGACIRHDPERINTLQQLPLPKTVVDLQQFLCAAGWMRDTLVDFGRDRVVLDWSAQDEDHFQSVKTLLSSSQLLHFPNATATVALFTDASDLGWGLVVTQVETWDPTLPIHEQHHQLLICKSGIFDDTERRWSIFEKEAYPIIWAARQLDYLLARPSGFLLFCDHKNLIFVFLPTHEVKRHGVHVKCKFVTRNQRRLEKATDRQLDELHPRQGDFIFPNLDDVKHDQQRHKQTASASATTDDNRVLVVNDLIRIPNAAKGATATHFKCRPLWWTRPPWIRSNVDYKQGIIFDCWLGAALSTIPETANVIQRPWGPTYNATERNELLHWDFLYLGKSKYLLVLKDSLTHFCELVACDAATSAVAASALVDWSKRLGAPKILISDQGSYFKNEVVKQVCKQLAIEQDLVLAYAPWMNGTIERLNRDVLQGLRVLLMEMNLDWHEWEYLVHMVEGALNHTPVASLGNRSPGELFTALPRPTPFEPVVN
ncbi:hypothetical protein PHMEG_00024041 [Phytophthora megakarya]|uniref:Integrase catalytic domain-containing protein n=1 Tax=Phytophthora megakarya TaxID=4795 RepID=A0A225VFN1_9STRA|nr:hypothetical protein PHMEG_00024041 [Phytophthora megakarya]